MASLLLIAKIAAAVAGLAKDGEKMGTALRQEAGAGAAQETIFDS